MIRAIYQAADWARHKARSRGNASHAMGRRGEDLAHRYLQRVGMLVVARNWRARPGGFELDIVARQGETLVFVEVKSRASEEFGAPDRAVGPDKRQRMLRAAREYARRADIEWRLARFDIVNVVFSDPPAITHLEDVLGANQTAAEPFE